MKRGGGGTTTHKGRGRQWLMSPFQHGHTDAHSVCGPPCGGGGHCSQPPRGCFVFSHLFSSIQRFQSATARSKKRDQVLGVTNCYVARKHVSPKSRACRFPGGARPKCLSFCVLLCVSFLEGVGGGKGGVFLKAGTPVFSEKTTALEVLLVVDLGSSRVKLHRVTRDVLLGSRGGSLG